MPLFVIDRAAADYSFGFHAGFGAIGSCAPAIDVGARP
jgi:hypothetical protein